MRMSARPVLVVDSDKEWCAHVCQILEPHGIPVIAAPDLTRVVATMDQVERPRALIMNIANRRDNSTAVSALRADVGWRGIPVGYVKKSAALDALLMLASSNAVSPTYAA
jgi:CheY-like chemotaxis protein